ASIFGEDGNLEVGLATVMQENETIAFHHRPSADAGARWNLLGVGDLDTGATPVEAPGVKGTLHAVAGHGPADAEMRAQMGTVGVEMAHRGARAAKTHRLRGEVAALAPRAARHPGGNPAPDPPPREAHGPLPGVNRTRTSSQPLMKFERSRRTAPPISMSGN